MNNCLIIAKNDMNGFASSILLSLFACNEPVIKFCRYDAEHIDINGYENIFIVGINKLKIKSNANIITLNNFEETIMYCRRKTVLFETNAVLQSFCEHVIAYLNWTWQEKEMYDGKDLDELRKYINKDKLIKIIAERILKEETLMTEIEKENIVFAKKLMTHYIQNKSYNIIEHNNKKYGCVYATLNEIELANKLINTHELDAVIVINLNNNIVRIKTKDEIIREKIANAGGAINSNGGTIKLNEKEIYHFNTHTFNSIINLLEGGI